MSSGSTTGTPPAALQASGPPYLPQSASMGGMPTVGVDVPISAVLLAFFIASAVFHMVVFQKNRRRGIKFIPSVLLFGFSMARIVTLVMRIVWANRPTNVQIAIAAGIFTAAGVVLLFVVNIIFSQRILRAYQPKLGWNKGVTMVFRFLLFCIIAMLIMVITVTVLSFYTLDKDTLHAARTIQLFATTYLATLAFVPVPVVALALLLPRAGPPENFGQGSMKTKVIMLLFTSLLLSFGAGFRTGANFDARPITSPAWYHHRAAFYIVNFVIELIVIYTYGLMRFDRRFVIPNGSSKPGDYSNGVVQSKGELPDNAHTDGETLENASDRSLTPAEARKEKEWERARESV